MKRKILIALIVVLALSVSVLAGCNLGIMSIELNSGSFADVYYVGDTVSLSNAKIKVTKSDGTTENVNVTAEMLSEPITTSEVGEKEYTITYEGKTTTFKIKVVNPTLSLNPNTVNYYVGDTVNLAAITVTVTKGEQSSNVALTQEMLGSKTITTDTAGNFTYEVTYQGVKVNLTVNVVAPTIAIDNESAYKKVYLVGETVDLTGMQLVVTKGTATTKVPVTAAMVEGATEPLAKGSKTFTVKYLGATATFTVEARKVESISLQNASLELIVGQPVPYADIKVIVKYEDIEQTETISATEAMFGDSKINVSAADEEGTDYTITYVGKTAVLHVTVINPAVESISVKTLNNVYYIGDTVDLSNAVLTVNFEGDAASMDIPIAAEMFGSNPIDTSAVASNVEYTITFGGKTTTATISVKDIAIVIGQFTATYNQFDEVNNNDTIKVVDAADNTVVLATIPVTSAMLDKAVSTDVAGTTTYTVTYTKNANVVRTVDISVTVKAMVLEVEGLKLTYEYGETVSYSGSLKIKFEGSENIVDTVPITENMFGANKISTTTVGDTTYTITYRDGVTVDVTIRVNPEKKPTINRFQMPQFYTDYETKSAAEDTSDANFKVNGAVYEVGNANKFILEPRIGGFDIDNSPLSISKGVHTIATFKTSSTLNGNYTEVTDLSSLVTVNGNTYQFEQNANGLYVELTISLDPAYYDFDEKDIISSRTMKFLVVDNGYNVYDQAGLAVMNDYLKPELWADILGCTVENGQYVAGSSPLTLEADSKPLYQYIGTVDWVILHGSINISPDNLPEGYFWNGSETDYITWYNAAGQEPTVGADRQALMLGSLRDADATHPDNSYLVSKNAGDNNNNKGLYSTTRVSISGNYNTIKIVEGTKEYTNTQGATYMRKLIGVAHRHVQDTKRRQEVGNQWDVFSMMEPLNAENAWEGAPVTTFVIKNTAMTGNTGHNENSVYAGMEMLRFYAHEVRLENVVANKFHINFKQDNYNSAFDNIITLANTKVYDTFNSMTFAWRGQIDITNSILKDCGGPLFIMADGDDYSSYESKYPIVNVDAQSYLESYAMGTEAWYRELNSAVVAKFATLKTADAGMRQLFHKSFWTERTVNGQTNSYASLIAIMIPEAGTAFGDSQWATTGHVVRGEYNLNVSDTQTDTFGMQDNTLREIIEKRDTNIFKSGNNYACQYTLVTPDGNQELLVSPEMYKTLVDLEDTNVYAPAQYFTSEAAQNEFKAWCYQWATTSTNILGLWMQGLQGQKYSPYLGIVFSNFNSVATQG